MLSNMETRSENDQERKYQLVRMTTRSRSALKLTTIKKNLTCESNF